MNHSWDLIQSQQEQLYNSNQPVKVNLNIKIPYIYRQEPVIYNLAYKYHLEVKILHGSLDNCFHQEALFSLQITGLIEKITPALKYIASLNVEFC